MSQRRAERLMNLHIMLLGARRFATKEAIRRACYPDYSQDAGGDDAFERAFERDKDALRALGAIIEVGNCDPLFDDEVGYRIPTEQTSLPAVRFEADEAAVLGVAAQVWEQATLAKATTRALDKLKADGVEVDPSRLSVLTPAITAVEPTFEALWEAVEKRRVVTFDYRRANDVNPTKRTLQPWGLVRSSARWYVVGHDTDRGQERVFRLSRIIGAVRAKGRQGAYVVPAGVDVREVAARLVPTSPQISAEVLVRKGTALDLRRRAESIVGHDEVWDLLVIDAAEQALVAEVLAHGEDAVVLSPSSLRAAVIAALTQVAEGDFMNAQSGSTETATDQVARLLALVPYLLARGEVRLEEAAAHFGTTTARLEQDLRVLFMTGRSPGLPGDLIEVDIEALEGDRVIRVDNADYLARPVRFSPAEATALLVALRTMLDVATPETAVAIESTLTKLERAVGAGSPARQMHVQTTPRRGADLVPILDQAIAHGHQLQICYRAGHHDEEVERVIDPRTVSVVDEVLYLDAWCHRAQDDRVFRVERIVSAQELPDAVLDPMARPRDLTSGWFTEAEAQRVTLRLGAPARWMSEYYPVENMRPGPGETLDVDVLVGNERWLHQLVLRLAPHAQVVDPVEVGAKIQALAQAALDTYEQHHPRPRRMDESSS